MIKYTEIGSYKQSKYNIYSGSKKTEVLYGIQTIIKQYNRTDLGSL
jgi:hypothetical protein